MALKKKALGWVLQASLLGSDAGARAARLRGLAKLEPSQHRGASVILFLAGTIEIVPVIPTVLQAISYFICELLKF